MTLQLTIVGLSFSLLFSLLFSSLFAAAISWSKSKWMLDNIARIPSQEVKDPQVKGASKACLCSEEGQKRVPVICWGNQTKMLGREQQGCHKECNPKHLLQLSGLDETLMLKGILAVESLVYS